MITIVVGGLRKDVMERSVKAAGGEHVQVIVTTDFDGAKKIKSKQADYYFGACNSGGGAALSIPIGLLGYPNCATVVKTGGRPDPKYIEKLVNEGKVAFGMAIESIEAAVPFIISNLLKKHNLS